MLMKVFNKGQVVIPAQIRRFLDIHVGDRLEVKLDRENGSIELRKPKRSEARSLGGSLAAYSEGKPFPTREDMRKALEEGLGDG